MRFLALHLASLAAATGVAILPSAAPAGDKIFFVEVAPVVTGGSQPIECEGGTAWVQQPYRRATSDDRLYQDADGAWHTMTEEEAEGSELTPATMDVELPSCDAQVIIEIVGDCWGLGKFIAQDIPAQLPPGEYAVYDHRNVSGDVTFTNFCPDVVLECWEVDGANQLTVTAPWLDPGYYDWTPANTILGRDVASGLIEAMRRPPDWCPAE